MRVLITGGAGFIGSHLAVSLLNDGHEVTIVDNLSTGSRENVPARAEFLLLDVTDPNFIQALPDKKFDAVCHLAGQSSGEKSFDNPLYDLDASVRSTMLLSLWAAKKSVPVFLYASTMVVYGNARIQPIPESLPAEPISFYGISRMTAEHILRVASLRGGLRTVSFRMFNVFGPGQNLANMKQGMVSIYLAYVLKKEPVLVRGSLERIRDHIYIDDVVSAWKMALTTPVSGNFNLASGTGTSVRAVLDELLLAWGHDPATYPVVQGDPTPGDQFAMTADISRIREALGWSPQTPLREGLRKMVAWAKGLQGAQR